MLLIYAPYKSNRLNYILDFLFKQVYNISYAFTYNKSDYDSFTGPKLAYSKESHGSAAWICSSEFLFESGLIDFQPQTGDTKYGKVIFPCSHEKSFMPFDIFAASFWLVSRYEEYLPHEKDKHGRFDYRQSWMFRNDVLHLPVINIWMKEFADKLQKLYPDLKVNKPAYRFIPTFDVDNLFAFKGKSFGRSFMAMGHAILAKRFDLVKLRLSYIAGKKDDPYDTYEFIQTECAKAGKKSRFFILTSESSEYDRNLNPNQVLFGKTIRLITEKSDVGLHASYYSTEKKSIADEKKLLEKAGGSSVNTNRFHFLRFRFPESYQLLIKSGIEEDYSMAYPEIPGFRAGTCSSFYFFDLANNEESNLLVYPMPYIDRTFIDYCELDSERSLEQMKAYVQLIKEYNGVFVSLWHNETLQDNEYWHKWRRVFEEILVFSQS